MEIIKLETEKQVIETLATKVEECSVRAIRENGVFRVGLSGGSLIKYLATGLPNIKTDWAKWQLFFCDERYVPVSSADSTFGAYKDLLLPHVPLSESQFVQIDCSLPLSNCAADYQTKIERAFGSNAPIFDLLLLGMGPDGHTCSLFPEHALLGESKLLVAPISDSPKPPPKRVTMTFPLINQASCCIFAMTGESKADMLKRVLVDKEPLPAGMVKPQKGNLYWIVDKGAGRHLP